MTSISQLTQLLWDEAASCLLQRVCELGETMSDGVHGTWFVDLLTGRTVGRWEGKALYVFSLSLPPSLSVLFQTYTTHLCPF